MGDEDRSVSETKNKGGGFFSKVARRVSVTLTGRRNSGKSAGSHRRDDDEGGTYSRTGSSATRRPSWQSPEVLGFDIYGNDDENEEFEMSVEDEDPLPAMQITTEALSVRSSAMDLPPRPLSMHSRHSHLHSPSMSVEARISSLGLPQSRRSVNFSAMLYDPAHTIQAPVFDISSLPVSSHPTAISPAEAAKTPRASLIPIPGGDILLPSPRQQRASWIPVVDGARTPTSMSRRSSSATHRIHGFDSIASINTAVSPPVAPLDRRRSGMPDAYAVPESALIAVDETASEKITEAQSEHVVGDSRFEPYRDMIKAGATEVQVAEAMMFFGVDHVEFFKRNVLEEAGIHGEQTEERKRNTQIFMDKHQLGKEQKRPTITESIPIIRAGKKASGHQKLNNGALSSEPVSRDDSTVTASLKEDTESESGAYKALKEAQIRLSNLSEAEIELRLRQQQHSEGSRQNEAEQARRLEEEERRREEEALARYRETQRIDAEHKAKEQARILEEEKRREEEEALLLARHREAQQAAEIEQRAREEAKRKADEEKAEAERNTRELEAQRKAEEERIAREAAERKADEERKAREEEARRMAEEEQKAKEQAELEARTKVAEEEKKRSEAEQARLKAAEARIEEERAKTAKPIVPPSREAPLEQGIDSQDGPASSKSTVIEGILLKKTKGGQWHSRAFTLRDKELSWVKSDQKTIARLLLTKDSSVRDVPVGLKKFMFEVTVPGHSPLTVSAAGATEKAEWIRAIRFAITGVEELESKPMQRKASLSRLVKDGKVNAAMSALSSSLPVSAGSTANPVKPIAGPSVLPRPGSVKRDATNDATAVVVAKGDAKPPMPRPISAKFIPAQLPQCTSCGTSVYKMEEVALKNNIMLHRKCFVCAQCKRQLTVANFAQHMDKVYCQTHYNELFIDRNSRQEASLARVASSDGCRAASTAQTETKRPFPILPVLRGGGDLPTSLGRMGRTASKLLMSAGLGGSGVIAPRASNGAAEIDNSAALSKPIVPSGKRRAPSVRPGELPIVRQQLGMEPQDRMTSEFTFKIVVDPTSPKNPLWMHATSRFERDQWVNILCNIIQALEMQRIFEDASAKGEASDAAQAQQQLDDFLQRNETSYSGYCEKLSIKSQRNWKRRWFSVSKTGELTYAEDESKKIKQTIRLTGKSVVYDAHDVRLSGPLGT